MTVLVAANEISSLTHDSEGGIDSSLGNNATNTEKSTEIENEMDIDNAPTIAPAVTVSKAANNEKLAGNEVDMDIEDAQTTVMAVVTDNNEKSAEIEQGENCTIASAVAAAASSKAVDMPPPTWLSNMLPYLHNVSDVKDWQDLVAALVEFEKANPPPGVSLFFDHSLLFCT